MNILDEFRTVLDKRISSEINFLIKLQTTLLVLMILIIVALSLISFYAILVLRKRVSNQLFELKESNAVILQHEEKLIRQNQELDTLVEERAAEIRSKYNSFIQAAEAVELAEEKFSVSFQKSPVAKCIVDNADNFRFLHINEKFLIISGFSREEVEGRCFHEIEFISKDIINALIFPDVEQGKVIKDLELTFQNKRGEIKTGVINIDTINVKSKALSLVVITDITERKEAERRIQERDELNARLINTIPYGMDIIDKDGKILFANENLKQQFGSDIIGKSCWEVMRDDQAQCIECPLKKPLKDGEIKVCESAGIKGNRVFEISHSGLHFNGKEAVLEIFHDVTERKRAEKENRQNERRLQGIFDNMQDAFLQADLSGNFSYINPMTIKMYGYNSADEILGKPASILYANKHERDEIIENLKKTGKVTDFTAKGLRKDGTTFWVSMNIQFLYDSKGNISGTQGIVRDITERKNAELEILKAKEKAESSEEQQKALIENAVFPITITSDTGKVKYLNKEAIKFFGLASNINYKELNPLIFWKNPDDRKKYVKQIFEQGSSVSFENEFLINNETSTVLISSSLINYNNEMVIFSAYNDITKRKKAEEERFELLTRFKQIAKHIPGFIYQYHLRNDNTSHFPYASDGIRAIYGVTPEDAMENAQCVFDVIHPDDLQRVSDSIFESAKKMTRWHEFYRVKLHSGETIWVEGHSTPVKLEDNSILWHGYIQNITELIEYQNELLRAKEKAEESEIQLKESQGIAKLGSWELNVETGIFTFNDNFYRIFKTTAEEIGGYNMTIEEYTNRFVYPDDRHLVEKEAQKSIEANNPNYNNYLDHRILYQDETLGYIAVRIFTKLDSQGKTVKTYGIIQDISDSKINEQELIKAKLKAEESDRLKTAFLLNVSHEIRTPMNGILGFMEFLNQPELSEVEKSEFMQIINKSGERLMITINDIVEISKIEIGDIQLHFEIINLSEIMRFHFNFFYPQIKGKGLDFELTNQIEILIKTDKHKLDSILMNLIKNAIKFTAKGKIEIGNYLSDNNICFYVSDTGIGIPVDKQEVIFGRFVQAELGLSRGYEGSGIGLSIVKAYVEALNGTIEVKSEVGKGSTFLVSIPFNKVENPQDTMPEKTTFIIKKSKPTLMIAEDDEVNFLLIEKILLKDFNILHAKNGEEAVRLFIDNPGISIVLMDIKMPGKYDGVEAIRKIKEINKNIPIIAQTAFAMDIHKKKAFDAGCDDYISKPYSSVSLKQLIHKYIGD